ncbi:alanine/glycine:cation symporter family protein [Allorhodopirellula solitaria]|nr:alanine/glycine:cation symporter family protein [Allorhodopirellula solitaria]
MTSPVIVSRRPVLLFLLMGILLSVGSPVSWGQSPEDPPPPAATGEIEIAVTDPAAADPAAADPAVGSEEPAASGLDQTIDEWFKPVADTWGGIVFFQVPLPVVGPIPFVLLLLVGGAAFFTIAFVFPNIRFFPLAFQVVAGKFDDVEQAVPEKAEGADPEEEDECIGEVTHFQALATAVSGTVGLGNIAGVAVAVATGGPGATFWMIVCGLLGMSTKFVECTLGVKYRDVDEDGVVYGGPMYYLQRGLSEMGAGRTGKVLASLFALFCIGGSFGGGNAFQSNQATQQIQSLMGLSPNGSSGVLIGLVIAVLVGFVIIGGIKRIAQVTEKIVPLMGIIYFLASVVIIAMNWDKVPWAFSQMFSGAFTPNAALGGLVGVMVQGFQRAAFSNEAGAGSAPIAHSAVKTRYPASEGIVALLEPFIDTVVICTMTAIVIVFFNADDSFVWGAVESKNVIVDGVRLGGVDLTSAAFDAKLPGFRYVLTIAIILFAFSTMISWSYYGLQSWKYLFGRGIVADLTYKLLFCLVIVIGAAISLGSVIDFSDAAIFAMVFPNMIGLVLLYPKVRDELRRYLTAIGKR